MILFLSSPKDQMTAHALRGRNVLLSYAMRAPVVTLDYAPTFRRLLIDSGVFSELRTGVPIDLARYVDWAVPLIPQASACAGVDDLHGDWRRSLANYEAFPEGFPTFHLTDPPELLDDLVAIACQRKQWLGLGMCGPQKSVKPERERWLRRSIDRIHERQTRPIHLHGWALLKYAHVAGIDSMDTSRWIHLAQSIKTHHLTQELTMSECVSVAVKQILRRPRRLRPAPVLEPTLWGDEP